MAAKKKKCPGAMSPPERDGFIPVRQQDVIDQLVKRSAAGNDADVFRKFCRWLGIIYHYTYFERLDRLRNDYFYFNPEVVPHAAVDADVLERSYADLTGALASVLKGANFVEVPHDEIARSHRESAEFQVELETSFDDFREVRFFRRGHRLRPISFSRWFGLRKETREVDIYDDVVLLVAMKGDGAITSQQSRRRIAQSKIRPGCILLKYFRNIASADLNALYPNSRVVLSLKDKLVLGVPALIGGVPVVLKLATSLTILLLVAGFYLGIVGSIEEDHLKKSIAAGSGLVALGGFLLQQWVKYQRQSLKHQKLFAENVYFRNINNNAGIFDYLIGAAEEQDCKEAILAYNFLLEAPMSQDALEQRVEGWLRDTFAVEVTFEVTDALGKLERIGLLRRQDGLLSVVPVGEATVRLGQIWAAMPDAPSVAHAIAAAG